MALWRETGKAGLALCARLAGRSGLLASVASSQQHQQRDFVKLPDLSQAANAIGTFLDGKVMEAKYIHPYMFKQAEFVGEDYNGNKYYEIKKGVLYGRHRRFVPPDIFEYSPASVPPEWHGWLHNINDDAPSRVRTGLSGATSTVSLASRPCAAPPTFLPSFSTRLLRRFFFLSFFSPRSLTLPPSHNRYLARPQVKFIEPSYKTEATTYKYLGYQPKGSYRKKLEFGRKRNWKKYQAWTPPSA